MGIVRASGLTRYKSPRGCEAVSEGRGLGSPLSLLTLREVRRYIRRSHAIAMTVTFVVLYALGSMVLGGMLLFANLSGGYQAILILGNGLGTNSWSYPGLLILAPWGIIELPFFATLSMVVVSIGVGIGMAVAVLLGVALVRSRRRTSGRPASVGSIAGLTPAMIALVTLGACCSTTAAATAGVGLVAQVSGSTTDNLLLNNWFLGVFQMAVVWVALVAQEIVLRVYGGLLGLTGKPTAEPSVRYVAPPVDRRYLAGGLLRVGLLVGGITWSLAMLVEWTSVDPLAASGALWFRWIGEHQLPAFLAVFAALFPSGTYVALGGNGSRRAVLALRVAAVVAGLALLVGAPPPLAGAGVEGFVNELMAVLGLPAAWGAVAPVFPVGVDLAFRWGLQYLLLGGFSLAFGLYGARALVPIRWTVGRLESTGAAHGLGAPGTTSGLAFPAPTAVVAEARVLTAEPVPSAGAAVDGP